MGYGGRTDDPKPAIGSMIDQSRISIPKRLEPRRDASGTDWRTFNVTFTLDGGGSVFVPDTIGADYRVRSAATISCISFWDASGALASLNFDLWLGAFGTVPTIANTILPAPIAIVAAASYEDTILANVKKQLIIGSILKLYVNSCAVMKRGVVELRLERAI